MRKRHEPTVARLRVVAPDFGRARGVGVTTLGPKELPEEVDGAQDDDPCIAIASPTGSPAAIIANAVPGEKDEKNRVEGAHEHHDEREIRWQRIIPGQFNHCPTMPPALSAAPALLV